MKSHLLYYIVGILLAIGYGLANYYEYDWLFLLIGLPIGCWLIWNISRDMEDKKMDLSKDRE